MNRRTLIIGGLLVVIAAFATWTVLINNGTNAMREADSRNGTGTYLQGQAAYITGTRAAELTATNAATLEVTDAAAQTATSP
ncbi:MAG: hypothetical protein ABI700_23055 [Chloroflexota bacterium]